MFPIRTGMWKELFHSHLASNGSIFSKGLKWLVVIHQAGNARRKWPCKERDSQTFVSMIKPNGKKFGLAYSNGPAGGGNKGIGILQQFIAQGGYAHFSKLVMSFLLRQTVRLICNLKFFLFKDEK